MKTFICMILAMVLGASFNACQNGQYVGPSIGANVGYQGVSVGVALYGPNPSAANISVVKEGTPTSAPSVPPAK